MATNGAPIGSPHRPGVSFAFAVWAELLEVARERERHSHLSVLQRREVDLEAEIARLAREVERVRDEGRHQLMRAEEEKALALERQLVELTGSAAEIAAVIATDCADCTGCADCTSSSSSLGALMSTDWS